MSTVQWPVADVTMKNTLRNRDVTNCESTKIVNRGALDGEALLFFLNLDGQCILFINELSAIIILRENLSLLSFMDHKIALFKGRTLRSTYY